MGKVAWSKLRDATNGSVSAAVPVAANDDVADEEAEQDEPVGVQEALVEPQGAHAADHLQIRDTNVFDWFFKRPSGTDAFGGWIPNPVKSEPTLSQS